MASKPRNIVLTGFMATGKTTVGRIVVLPVAIKPVKTILRGLLAIVEAPNGVVHRQIVNMIAA